MEPHAKSKQVGDQWQKQNLPKGQNERQQSLSPDFLQSVANHIHPRKWKPVFRDLMTTYRGEAPVDVMIGDIERNHRDDVVEQKYQALQKWKTTMGDAATWEKLEEVLEKNGCPYGEEKHPIPADSGALEGNFS